MFLLVFDNRGSAGTQLCLFGDTEERQSPCIRSVPNVDTDRHNLTEGCPKIDTRVGSLLGPLYKQLNIDKTERVKTPALAKKKEVKIRDEAVNGRRRMIRPARRGSMQLCSSSAKPATRRRKRENSSITTRRTAGARPGKPRYATGRPPGTNGCSTFTRKLPNPMENENKDQAPGQDASKPIRQKLFRPLIITTSCCRSLKPAVPYFFKSPTSFTIWTGHQS